MIDLADSPKVPLLNRPGVTNWVERTGALGGKTNWIRRCAEHLQGKGMMEGHAIAVAVNAAQKYCETGDVNWPGIQHANAGGRAEACAAYARWKAAHNAARATNLTTADETRTLELFALIDLAKVRLGGKIIDLAAPTAAKRKRAEGKRQALPGGRFPIENLADLRKAIKAVGRAKGSHDSVRRFIIRRARALNASHMIPDNWKASGAK